MKKIFISTSTFAQFSATPLKLFEEVQYDVVLNDKGRKLNEDEINLAVSAFDGIIAHKLQVGACTLIIKHRHSL